MATEVSSAARFQPFDPSKERIRRVLGWLLLFGAMVWLAVSAFMGLGGQGPVRIAAPVTDLAGVIGPGQAQMIDRALRRHRAQTDVQMAVLTVRTTGGVPIEDFSYRVAEAWGGGQAGRDYGVLFVLAVQDRRMRLEVGRGLEAQITDADAARFIDELPPLLRDGRYGAASARMVDRVMAATGGDVDLEGDLPPTTAGGLPPGHSAGTVLGRAFSDTAPWPHIFLVAGLLIVLGQGFRRLALPRGLQAAAQRARFYDKLRLWPHMAVGLVFGSALVAGLVQSFGLHARGAVVSVPILVGFAGLLVGLPIVAWARRASRRYWRVQPRGCLEGDGMMRQIDPDGAEGGLSAGQQTEVAIRSREYDVWLCPNGHRQVVGFRGDDPADECPQCDFCTLRRGGWVTVRAATYNSTGRKERDVDCRHCGYASTESAIIPRRTRSSSSSSGGGFSSGSSGGGWSGGGGSFGGGGASGSW